MGLTLMERLRIVGKRYANGKVRFNSYGGETIEGGASVSGTAAATVASAALTAPASQGQGLVCIATQVVRVGVFATDSARPVDQHFASLFVLPIPVPVIFPCVLLGLAVLSDLNPFAVHPCVCFRHWHQQHALRVVSRSTPRGAKSNGPYDRMPNCRTLTVAGSNRNKDGGGRRPHANHHRYFGGSLRGY